MIWIYEMDTIWLESESRLSNLKYRIADQGNSSGGEAKRCDFWDCHTPCCTHTPCCIVTLTHTNSYCRRGLLRNTVQFVSGRVASAMQGYQPPLGSCSGSSSWSPWAGQTKQRTLHCKSHCLSACAQRKGPMLSQKTLVAASLNASR